MSSARLFLIFLAMICGFSNAAFAADKPSGCVITIKSVQLEKALGEWVTVIEPDHVVDLAIQEATVSFFNNGRRVPPGDYRNFKIIFDNHDTGEKIEIRGLGNFSEPLKVEARSFIRVAFELNLAGTLRDSRVENATVVVDDRTLSIPGKELRMIF